MHRHVDEFSKKPAEKIYSYSESSDVALSQKASRFWIPFDVKLLETLTPKEYLEKYCRVNHRRWVLYKRIFDKYKDVEAELHMEILPDALSDVYMGIFDSRLIKNMIILLDLSSNAKITFTQFNGIAAFSERYLFNVFRQPNTKDSPLQKEILEILDFSSLERKLSGVKVSPTLLNILKFI